MTPGGPRASPGRLRVALRAADPARYRSLAALVAASGHEVAEMGEGAVLLLDGPLDDAPDLPGQPALSLGDPAADTPGLLPRNPSPAQLDAALRAVAAGLLVRAPRLFPGFAMLRETGTLLTPREMEILALVGEGDSNKAAARRLGISQHTVKFHLEAVFAKLGVRTRAEAVAEGLRRGVVELREIGWRCLNASRFNARPFRRRHARTCSGQSTTSPSARPDPRHIGVPTTEVISRENLRWRSTCIPPSCARLADRS